MRGRGLLPEEMMLLDLSSEEPMLLQDTYCQFIDEEAEVQRETCPNYKTTKGQT